MSLSSTLSSTAGSIVSKFYDPSLGEGSSLSSAAQSGASDASSLTGSAANTGNNIVSKFYDSGDSATAQDTLSNAASTGNTGNNDVSKFYDPANSASGTSALSNASNAGTAFTYGTPSPSANDASSTDGQTSGQSSGSTDLTTMLQNLLSELLTMLSQMMQSNQNSDSSSGDNGTANAGTGTGSTPTFSAPPTATASPAAAPSSPASTATSPSLGGLTSGVVAPTDTIGTSTEAAGTPATAPAATAAAPAAATAATPSASSATTPSAASSATGAGPTVGTGPRSFNITNTQDQPITLGQFDQNNQLVSQMTLQPGQTGTMKAENDTSGVIKQADSDGNFQSDASRLEYYNGYINTSDIDGRNASISATDNNGFNIGDSQSIGDNAPASVTTEDSAGNKTIAGYYDGSTATMNAGANYMIGALSQNGQSATGETYFHPNDDTLGQGNNPMRHTDSMSVDVSFGKA